jgi:hypothetical protein
MNYKEAMIRIVYRWINGRRSMNYKESRIQVVYNWMWRKEKYEQ